MAITTLRVPGLEEAQALLAEAAARNPGPWVDHSQNAAIAARAIASRHPDLDSDTAYVLGLLHDIGRGDGGPDVADVRHILDGDARLRELGYADAGRVCLTHSFPLQTVDAYASAWNVPYAEKEFVREFLLGTTYTEYDRLIQLCDSLALPTGCCLIEQRLVDVVLRHGFNEHTLAKWRAVLAIQADFERAIGTSIYRVVPGVVENALGE